jgi:signal transduction histidine kinase/ActR/RegA family two-component response regulator/HAMP domain-containing protein
MKISTKLYLTTAVAIGFILLLFLFISQSTREISTFQQKVETAEQLVQHTTHLVISLDEYLTYGYARTEQAMTSASASLTNLTKKLPSDDARFVSQELEGIHSFFTRIKLETTNLSISPATKNQYSSQIRVSAHKILSRAFILSRKAHKEIGQINQRNADIAMRFALLLIIFLPISAVVTIKGVTKPLNALIDDAGAIERGDRSKVINLAKDKLLRNKNEIGKLAQAFNSMTIQLDRTIQALQSNEKQLSLALKGGKCGLWDWTISEDKLHFDSNYYLISGYQPYDFPERFEEWEKRVHPDDVSGAKMAIERYMAGETETFSTEFRFKRKDETWMWILGQGEIVDRTSDGTPARIVGLHVDINIRKRAESDRLELERQLQQKVKMEAIGIMAGGVAHNFNNNLAIILGNLEISSLKLPPHSLISEYLENAQIATLRSRDLVQQILSYSRDGVHDKAPLRLSQSIEETYKMLTSTIPSTVKLHQHISKDCHDATINADASRIQEILLNLCNNAVDAMEEKGDLTISLEKVENQALDIPTKDTYPPGSYVKISVNDTGCGMPVEILDKIFDPFFTTKEVNKGTGLGLSTVQGIVEQHNGYLKVASVIGKGSTFELFFPIIACSTMERLLPFQNLNTGDEKIMLVDDDEMLANIGERMLSDVGYQVTALTQSTKALKLFKDNPDFFDLVITDQTMPELSGKDLIKEMLKIRPNLPIILSTGYSSKVTKEDAEQLDIKAFCMKPMDMVETIKIVRTVLDEAKVQTS